MNGTLTSLIGLQSSNDNEDNEPDVEVDFLFHSFGAAAALRCNGVATSEPLSRDMIQ